MAKALSSPTYEKEVNHFDQDYDSNEDSDDEEEEMLEDSSRSRSPKSRSPVGRSPNKDIHSRETPDSQKNGSVTMQFDRYGFVGGKEFTDPDE